jgi:hypothetical protein
MPRLPGRKAVPWMLMLEAVMLMREHWSRLPSGDQRELRRLLAKSKGRPTNLTARDRDELKRLVRALEPFEFGKRLMPISGGLRRRRKH